MSTLVEIRDRVEETLKDTSNVIWDTDAVDESIRKALDGYSEVLPCDMTTVIDVLSDGREIALNELDGLKGVKDVWWPYDTLDEIWPPNKVMYRIYWDDARPVLFINSEKGNQPEQDDEIRIEYTKRHTVDGLDSEAVTTVPEIHISKIIVGAAYYATMARASDKVEAGFGASGVTSDYYAKRAKNYKEEWKEWLEEIRVGEMGGGMPKTQWSME